MEPDYDYFEIKKINRTSDDAYNVDLSIEKGKTWNGWVPKAVSKMSDNKKVLYVEVVFARQKIFYNDD